MYLGENARLEPVGNYVLIQQAEAETKVGSIELPAAAQERPHVGKIVAAGPDVDPRFPIGCSVMYHQWAGTEIELERNKPLLILRAEEILGVVTWTPSP